MASGAAAGGRGSGSSQFERRSSLKTSETVGQPGSAESSAFERRASLKARFAPFEVEHDEHDRAHRPSTVREADEGEPIAGRPTMLAKLRLMSHIFPFLKLREGAASTPIRICFCKRRGKKPKEIEIFVSASVMWLLMVIVYSYFLLTMSAQTLIMKDSDQGGITLKRKEPQVGNHMQHVVLLKRLMEVLILHYLCSNIMQPLPGLHDVRISELEEAHPHGLIHWMLRSVYFLTGRAYSPMWFSSFIADHILLVMVGVAAIAYQIELLLRKLHFDELKFRLEGDIDLEAMPNWIFAVIETAAAIYAYILVVGFLIFTLEGKVVAKKNRRVEFKPLMSMFVLFWSSNFFYIMYDRQLYTTSFLFQDEQATKTLRLSAGLAQLFITHSSVMFGAVLCGHSAHFKKSPDLTWTTVCCKLVPTLLLVFLYYAAMMTRRSVHTTQECNPLLYEIFAKPWPYVDVAWQAFAGSVLLYLAFRHRSEHEDGDNDEITESTSSMVRVVSGASRNSDVAAMAGIHFDMQSFADMLDYDLVLIIGTYSVAMLAGVTRVFEYEADRFGTSFVAAIFKLLAPVGTCGFALVCWRHPPHKDTTSSRALWFALVFAMTQCGEFQQDEDCEIAGGMPACCRFPGLPDYNKGTQVRHCNRLHRCLHQHNGVYCALPEDQSPGRGHGRQGQHGSHSQGYGHSGGEDHGEHGSHSQDDQHSGHGEHGDGQHGLHQAATHTGLLQKGGLVNSSVNFARLLKNGGPDNNPGDEEVVFDKETCTALNKRWKQYKNMYSHGVSMALHEFEQEEEGLSTAFRLLVLLGQAGCVEMYFTVCGIILKVIFLTEHPNAEKILQLSTHHHHVDPDTGENAVASSAGPRGMRRFRLAVWQVRAAGGLGRGGGTFQAQSTGRSAATASTLSVSAPGR
eukprot:TRINITY_DN92084_c0_g1_i2.p1 TRINITY_DN92084_c0_g1~~TRINITY_DN92084_c0_g1_i2.p1  ORF type:complete len:907 (+),score=115.95 TRINITY_DN92084_c0_g1_i2:129-2849(+)